MLWKYVEPTRFQPAMFALFNGEQRLFNGYAQAYHVDKRWIDTRSAELIEKTESDGGLTLVYKANNGLILTETLTVDGDAAFAKCALSDSDGSDVESRRLVPLIAFGGVDDAHPVWSNLQNKQLLIPFDNDQWLRYEAVPFRVGQVSYDMTVVFDDVTREGFLIGAMDFNVWKNGMTNSHTTTNAINCVCGIAFEGTHDVCEHGSIIGKNVESSRFAVLSGPDYRDLLEAYGDLLYNERKPIQWEEGITFGFNAFAGLGMRTSNEIIERTAKFLRNELAPRSFGNNGVTYTNLDGGWQMLEATERLRIKDEMHANGQKAGVYDGIFVCRPFGELGFDAPLPGLPDHTYNEILLRNEQGEPLPPVDNLYAFDVTHPVWREFTAVKFAEYKKSGYDYLKIDFLTHGCMEGVHYDKNIRTGRQALTQAYEYINELIDEKNYGQPLFLSMSIAPIFPYGYGHARRFCCDSFGTNQYIEYVLNTQTYGWWQNRRLYDLNDPDHIVLLKSFNVKRDSYEGEARARYTTGAISGGPILLSDDYDRPEAVERALKFATNAEVNNVARSRVAFRPVESNWASASHAYTATIDGDQYVAVFTWTLNPEHVEICADRAGIELGVYRDLWTGKTFDCTDGKIVWDTDSCDALLLKLEK